MSTEEKVKMINSLKFFVKDYIKALVFSYSVVEVKKGLIPSDINTEYSPLTEGYNRKKETYQEYFERNLNPDTACYKFLDELDRILSVSKKRIVIIESENKDINYAKVVGNYLSLQ